MSVSQDFYLGTDVPRDTLSEFLVEVCRLRALATDRPETLIYECEDFHCEVTRTSELRRTILAEKFGFASVWQLSYFLKSIPHHNSHPRMLETFQLLLLRDDSDCVWLTN